MGGQQRPTATATASRAPR